MKSFTAELLVLEESDVLDVLEVLEVSLLLDELAVLDVLDVPLTPSNEIPIWDNALVSADISLPPPCSP
ncbi:hypothetical protein [Tolumonas lignilytica]|jgi:hypothetical protein|uniref:hypothetical protein n=1 Tax=Tolumonas lignilytica TaxID=1283284 RepID=UPI0004B29C05|nr:hypothetical protein [Tolumonas lignilytica]